MTIIAKAELENGTRFFFSEAFRITLNGRKAGTPIVAMEILEDGVTLVRANGVTLNIGDPKQRETDEDGAFETFCRMMNIEKEVSERLDLIGENAAAELHAMLAPIFG